MTLAIQAPEAVGIPYIDQAHNMIADSVNSLCEDLACRKPLNDILEKVDKLIDDIQPYINERNNCQNHNACKNGIVAQDIILRLVDLRSTFANFGDAMPPSVAILETQQWAQLHIFNEGAKCSICPKRCAN
ncbi:hypothetical protein RYZ26_03110 [Terasakiella sp. A23]|uniref:hypothetical protein n=1 Tax=Terasakiella sp. FCG-A23 TaxID=3080561 RepID=UPI002955C31D|nr:hypothetical protein [Terasakiella sp. A23]MDV7338570.1 hypothetical protein [Terasakiella sp. A23]